MSRFSRSFFAIGLMLVVGSQASAGTLGTVFVIDMENHNFTQPTGLTTSPEQLLGNPAAPYLNSLITPGNPNAAQVSYASQYFNVAPGIHPSEPNYIWQEAGSNFGTLNDNDPYNPAHVQPGPNLSGLLQAKFGAKGWRSYQEDIQLSANPNLGGVPTVSFSGTLAGYTNPYNGTNQYNYAVKHNGQPFFTTTNGGTLTTPLLGPSNPEAPYYSPLTQLASDLASNNVAKYNLITPDQYNDMHSALTGGFTYNGVHYTGDQAGVAQGDNFLSILIPQIMASQAYKNNGAIVIWFDETEGGDTNQFTLPEIVISPLAKGNAYDSTLPYTHSSDLKTLEELFGVGPLLGDAATPGTNDLSDLFLPGAITTTPEPSSMALFALGAAVLAGWRLRRKK